MARALTDEDTGEGSGEYKRPDMKGAIKIYREEIAPKKEHIATIKGDLSEPHKRIKDECHAPRKVLDFLFQLDDMEDAKRDHYLIALYEGMRELKIFMPSDLVTRAQGVDGLNVIPMGERKAAEMATLGEFDEATPEELAAQTTRPSTVAAKAKAEAEAEEAA